MYQLNAVPGRTFAALRLDRQDLDEEEDEAGDGVSTSEHISRQSALSGAAQSILSILRVLFGTFVPSRRLKLLQSLCQRWSVRVPRKTASMSENDYCRGIMQRLAMKISLVMDRKVLVNDGRSLGFSSANGAYADQLSRYSAAASKSSKTMSWLSGGQRRSLFGRQSLMVDDLSVSAGDSIVTIHAKKQA
ncbi:receptor-type adenylate cyclase [Trypanosoma grayi]|uniref:receptor-type adenylate cyclase n=1 Tax=Trypanosoma grayi TaxID=71804 RepID=UPI0004F4080F|nr:receptor-type adenylate cyclase [Trypanosoma grayi]KEG05337.1 receptor-type adenylate cyclase [Trypanosoma grayi]